MTYKIIEDIDKLTDLALSVGTQANKNKRIARPLTPIEVAEYIQMIKNETGESDKDISKRLKLGRKKSKSGVLVDINDDERDDSQVKNFLKLLKISKKSVHLIGFLGNISPVKFSTAAKLYNLEHSDQDLILKAVVKHKLVKDEVGRILQYQKKYKIPFDDCIEKVIHIRPEISNQYMVAYNIPNSVDTVIKKLGSSNEEICKKLVLSVSLKLSCKIDELTIDDYLLIIFMDDLAYEAFEKLMNKNNFTYNQCMKYILIGDLND